MQARIPESPPVIYPCSHGEKFRPLWSVMIPAYNCSTYLPETLQSVLNQDLGPELMQIEVVDDASTDDNVALLVDKIGKGRIQYYRQESNVGSLRNFETCLQRSKGKYVHLLHGDDVLLQGFYTEMKKLFDDFPTIGAACCRFEYIDENGKKIYTAEPEAIETGILENWLYRLYERQRIQTVSIVVKRNVYEDLGSFYAVHYGEDWEMWMRIAAKYSFAYCPKILAQYRKHSQSITGNYILSGENIRDIKKVLDIAEKFIPVERQAALRKKAERFYAHYALKTANQIWGRQRNKTGVINQIAEAKTLGQDLYVWKEIIKLQLRMAFNI